MTARIPTPAERRELATLVSEYLALADRRGTDGWTDPMFLACEKLRLRAPQELPGLLRALDIAEAALKEIRRELDVEPGFRVPAGGAWKMANDALAQLRGEPEGES